MSETTVRVGIALLAAVFAWAALAKLFRWRNWSDALARYDLPSAVASPARVLVPLAEALVAAAILSGATLAGSVLALGLLAVFTAVLLRTGIGRGEAVPCGCFGGKQERPASLALLRNFALAIPAALAVSDRSRPRLLDGVSPPTGADLVPVSLIIVGLGLSAWLLRHLFFGRPSA